MNKTFKITSLKHNSENSPSYDFLTADHAQKVLDFHRTFPMYAQTPLAHLSETAKILGLGDIYVKDESKRFGLNAFKVLGGSYAIGSWLAEKAKLDPGSLSFALLTSAEFREKMGDITFITATDGNHGRGVAWTAAQLGMKSVVYMPKGTAKERLDNILALGSDAKITDVNYDDTVRMASADAEKNGWVLIQDTAAENYEKIPKLIIQGYCTMALEVYHQLPKKPTHIFLQAGVGSMAGMAAGLFASLYGNDRPTVIIVEPDKADCIFRTAEANDGQLHAVTGDLDTIMAGLACGEPCSIAWEILRDCADHFISCPDYTAAKGMRILGNPAGSDDRVISGESGASTFGCAAEIMTNPALAGIRAELGLDSSSRVLFFSTEGATDTQNYRSVVWDGKYPSFEN